MYKINISSRTLHFLLPAGISHGVCTTRKNYYVTLSDTSQLDVVGIGECATLLDLSYDAMTDEEYEQKSRSFCDDFCHTGVIDIDAMRPYPSMLFGLETAKTQLNAKGSINFFNTAFRHGEKGVIINGLVRMGTFDEMYQRLGTKLKAGFHCVKLKISAVDFEKELDLIRHIRQTFTREQVELRVGANGVFTPGDAMQRLETLAQYDIHSIEQPIRQHQWQEMVRLCADSPLPIALNEELIGVNNPAGRALLLDTIRPQYIILEPSLHGGMTGIEEWITMTRGHSIDSRITSALENNIGLNTIAQPTADIYDPNITIPQGLGTGQLFTDNILVSLEIRDDQLWISD